MLSNKEIFFNTGAGGTNYDDVIKEHGQPSKESTTKKKTVKNKVISYVAPGNNIKSVTPTFDKPRGRLLLTYF